jgi:hypothetical protein
MKSLKNKKTGIIKEAGKPETLSYSELAIFCVNSMPEGGFDVTEMRNRIKILDALDKANGTVKIEDAATETLKACVNSMKWAFMHKDVVSFIEEVEKM